MTATTVQRPSAQPDTSRWATASDNFSAVLMDPKSYAGGKLTLDAVESLLGSIETHGVTQKDLDDTLAVAKHLAETGHATNDIIAMIRARVTGDNSREGWITKLVAETLELVRDNRLPTAAWTDRPPPDAATVNSFLQIISGVQHDVAVKKNIPVGRGFHYEQLWGGSADVVFNRNLPAWALQGPLKDLAGTSTKAMVRFSHGTICPHMSKKPDVFGVGVKIAMPKQEGDDGPRKFVDILATNAPMQLAHDTEQFVKFAQFTAELELHGGLAAGKELIEQILRKHFSAEEALRIGAFLTEHVALHEVENIASESYWSQDHQFGEFVGRVVIQPGVGAESARGGLIPDEGFERKGMEQSLADHDVTMTLAIQLQRKSGELDGAEALDGRMIPIGTIRFAQRAPDTAARTDEEALINTMGFDPTHGVGGMVGGFKPEDRGKIYAKSRENRGAIPDTDPRVQAAFDRLCAG